MHVYECGNSVFAMYSKISEIAWRKFLFALEIAFCSWGNGNISRRNNRNRFFDKLRLAHFNIEINGAGIIHTIYDRVENIIEVRQSHRKLIENVNSCTAADINIFSRRAENFLKTKNVR